MSCVSCEMSCVKELGWSSVREHEAAPPNATRKQLLRELSCVRWVEWDELCEMSCVTCEMRGVVWDEMCALCETTWVKLREKEATQEEKEEKARNTNLKNKSPTQRCEEKNHNLMSCVMMLKKLEEESCYRATMTKSHNKNAHRRPTVWRAQTAHFWRATDDPSTGSQRGAPIMNWTNWVHPIQSAPLFVHIFVRYHTIPRQCGLCSDSKHALYCETTAVASSGKCRLAWLVDGWIPPRPDGVTLKMITIRGAPSLKAWAISIYRSFRHFFEASSPEAIVYTKEVVEDLFKQLDLNGDGKVTSDEFSKKEVDTAIAKASRAAHADDRWHQIEKFITGSSRSQIISNGCLSEIIGKTHLRWYSLSLYILDAHLSCSVVQALAKLAMDKAFDFQELRKPGDTDLVAIDRVFEKCRICKEHQGNRSYHLYTAWARWKWDGSLLQNKNGKKHGRGLELVFFPHFHGTKRAAPLILRPHPSICDQS